MFLQKITKCELYLHVSCQLLATIPTPSAKQINVSANADNHLLLLDIFLSQ